MGYTHYWRQFRPFTEDEWARITAEANRICAKAQSGLYAGSETPESNAEVVQDNLGFRVGFKEPYAWRTFAHPESAIPTQGKPIRLAGPGGTGSPIINAKMIALNGVEPDEDYESFVLESNRKPNKYESTEEECKEGLFSFCKTEYRPYDAIVVSILHVARTIAPDAIKVSSDGGPEAIKLLF